MSVVTTNADESRSRYSHNVKDTTKCKVASASVIEKGDVVCIDSGELKPASDLWSADIATTQAAVHDAYLGIALENSAAGNTDEILVAVKGIFRFDVDAAIGAALVVGAFVGVGENGTSDGCLNQAIDEDVVATGLKIGIVAEEAGTSDTEVLVSIVSVVMAAS